MGKETKGNVHNTRDVQQQKCIQTAMYQWREETC